MPATVVAAGAAAELGRLASLAVHLDRYDHIFVASRHAVPPLVEALSAAGHTPASAPPVTAVGPATTAALIAAAAARSRGDTGRPPPPPSPTSASWPRILAPRAAGGDGHRPPAVPSRVADIAFGIVAAAAAARIAAGRAADRRPAACMLFARQVAASTW
jgi:hypothetical protein